MYDAYYLNFLNDPKDESYGLDKWDLETSTPP